ARVNPPRIREQLLAALAADAPQLRGPKSIVQTLTANVLLMSPDARQLLQLIAMVAPDDIPMAFVVLARYLAQHASQLVGADTATLVDGLNSDGGSGLLATEHRLDELERCSLVCWNREGGTISVHRVVQHIVLHSGL